MGGSGLGRIRLFNCPELYFETSESQNPRAQSRELNLLVLSVAPAARPLHLRICVICAICGYLLSVTCN
jgi:hypothetical protein